MSFQQNYAKFDSSIMEESVRGPMDLVGVHNEYSNFFRELKYFVGSIFSGVVTIASVIIYALLILYVIYFVVSLFSKGGKKTLEELKSVIQGTLNKIQDGLKYGYNVIKNTFRWISSHKKISIIVIVLALFINFLNGVIHNNSKLVKIVKIQNGFIGVDLRNKNLMEPGYHIYLPYISDFFLSKTSVFDFQIAAATANTKEDMFVELDYKVGFSMKKEELIKFYTTYGAKNSKEVAKNIVMPRVLEILKKVIKEYSFKEISSKHNEIKTKMIDETNKVLSPLGIVLNDINVLDIRLPQSYIKSIENLEKAENELKLAESELTKQKKEAEKEELKAKTSKKIQIIQAEGIAEYNKILRQNPPSKEMLELKKIEIEKLKVEKWNGSLSENRDRYITIPNTQNIKKSFIQENN